MDWSKRTAQLLGRFQPWHQGHTELFKRALHEVGQVAILLRHQDGSEKDPYNSDQRSQQIILALQKENFYEGEHFIIMPVPNIAQVAYGREVGYGFQCYRMSMDIESISATKIRNKEE